MREAIESLFYNYFLICLWVCCTSTKLSVSSRELAGG